MLKRAVGFDLSLNQSGWATFEKGETVTSIAPACPVKNTDPYFEVKRLRHIAGWFKSKIGTPQENTLVVMEGISFASKSGTADQIAGMHYLCRYMLVSLKVPYLIVSPATLKKFVLGKGVGKKELVLKGVLKAFRIDVDTSDQADAAVLSFIGRAFIGEWPCQTKAQKDVIADLKKKNPHLLESLK